MYVPGVASHWDNCFMDRPATPTHLHSAEVSLTNMFVHL